VPASEELSAASHRWTEQMEGLIEVREQGLDALKTPPSSMKKDINNK
jgi:hypothetical protein